MQAERTSRILEVAHELFALTVEYRAGLLSYLIQSAPSRASDESLYICELAARCHSTEKRSA